MSESNEANLSVQQPQSAAPALPEPTEQQLQAALDKAMENDVIKALQDQVISRRDRLEVIEATAQRRLEMLKQYEWAGPPQLSPQHTMDPTCPSCHARQGLGHTETCELKLELA